ncbi:MAG: glycosyltransferase family 4 protein, partial [Rhodospirillaceae bacterium]
PLPFNRRGVNPFGELRLLSRVIGLLRRERPDLIHNVAIKPAVHGGIAAWCAGAPPVATTMAGMGYVYISDDLKARLLRPLITGLFRWILDKPRRVLMVQNADDKAFFAGTAARKGILAAERVSLVRGSGVDTQSLQPLAEPPQPEGSPVRFAYVGRMLTDKGLVELADAARILKAEGAPVEIVLIGEPDPGNPKSIPEERLKSWEAEGLLSWWGHRDDMAEVWGQCHGAVLPSYREGLPKALLEAGACGRASITTDAPGCRELVVDGETGLLVPVRSVEPLAEALRRLAQDPARRQAMGLAARERVVAGFSAEAIGRETVAVYRRLLADR